MAPDLDHHLVFLNKEQNKKASVDRKGRFGGKARGLVATNSSCGQANNKREGEKSGQDKTVIYTEQQR